VNAVRPHAPQVSVVVATRRRPALLARCLRALAQQRHESFEVIVVDDGPCDDTRAAVEAAQAQWPGHSRLRLVRPAGGGGRGPAAARNAGWCAAHAPIIAFTDDDTLPRPDWLAQGASCLRDTPGLSAVAGRLLVPLPAGRPPTEQERLTQGLERTRFATANAFVRRDALHRVGGFDTRFTRARREDSDLHARLDQPPGAVGRCDDAIVVHPARREPAGVWLRPPQNVSDDTPRRRKHRCRCRREVRRAPPWDHYVIVAATLAVPPLVVAGAARAALAVAAVALLLVGRLAWLRLRRTRRSPRHLSEMLLASVVIPFLSVWWRLRGAWQLRAGSV
jgi:glycosyltransferase involved in cell wall biosynthesis